jgi:cupin fold WbuC family metalloprotein
MGCRSNEVYQHMKLVTAGTITELLLSASVSPRKRMNLNLHEPGSPVSRFINAGIAGTYVRPHRHQIDKWELVSVIKGHFDLLIFTPDGVVKDRITLSPEGVSVAEIPGGTWHTVRISCTCSSRSRGESWPLRAATRQGVRQLGALRE